MITAPVKPSSVAQEAMACLFSVTGAGAPLGDHEVAGHDRPDARVHRRAERDQFDGAQLLLGARQHGQLLV